MDNLLRTKLAFVSGLFILIAGLTYSYNYEVNLSPGYSSYFDYFYIVLGVVWILLAVFIIRRHNAKHMEENKKVSPSKTIYEGKKAVKIQKEIIKNQKKIEKSTKKIAKKQKLVEKKQKQIEKRQI